MTYWHGKPLEAICRKIGIIRYGAACLLWLVFSSLSTAMAGSLKSDLTGMSIEALMDIEIISLSKKNQKLAEAPAAVFVINQEDLRRSGVTTIPEALRMVPGIQVAKINANHWAITARGFNGRFGNKLMGSLTALVFTQKSLGALKSFVG